MDLEELLQELDLEEDLLEQLEEVDFEELMQQVEEGDIDSIETSLVALEPLLEEYQDELKPVIADLVDAVEQSDVDIRAVYFSLDAMETDLGEIMDLLAEFTDVTLMESFESGDVWTDPESITAFAEELNELQSEVADYGLEFGYYTSGEEFEEIDGSAGYEILVDELDANVKLQLDVAAALEGDVDVMALIEELGGLGDQFEAIDISGLSADADEEAIVDAASSAGVDYIVRGFDDVQDLE